MVVTSTKVQTGNIIVEQFKSGLTAGNGQDSIIWTPPLGVSVVEVLVVGGGGGKQ
jgi:hypothetical protein